MPPDSPTPMRASASVATHCAMPQKTVIAHQERRRDRDDVAAVEAISEARGKGQIWHDTIVGRAQERNRRLLE